MPKKSEADKAAEKAAERTNAINEADATFKEEVAKAAEKRAKAIEKVDGASTNLAEAAWDATKAEADPRYRDSAQSHRQKLDAAVVAIQQTGNADIVGLEEFEKEVKRLIAERGETIGEGALVASTGPGRGESETTAEADTETVTSKKAGKAK